MVSSLSFRVLGFTFVFWTFSFSGVGVWSFGGVVLLLLRSRAFRLVVVSIIASHVLRVFRCLVALVFSAHILTFPHHSAAAVSFRTIPLSPFILTFSWARVCLLH